MLAVVCEAAGDVNGSDEEYAVCNSGDGSDGGVCVFWAAELVDGEQAGRCRLYDISRGGIEEGKLVEPAGDSGFDGYSALCCSSDGSIVGNDGFDICMVLWSNFVILCSGMF